MSEEIEKVKVTPISEALKNMSSTPPAEPPVEPPAPPAEPPAPPVEPPANPDETPEVENTLFEKIKQEPTPPVTPPTVDPEIQKKLDEYNALAEKLKQYESNPLLKAMDVGADLKEIAKKIIGVDASKMTVEQLYEAKLKQEFGLEGQDLSEAVAEEVAALEGKSKLEKLRIEKELRSEVESKVQSTELLAELTAYEQSLTKDLVTPDVINQRFEAIKTKDFQDIDSAASRLVGSKAYGVEITKEFVDSIKEDYYGSVDKFANLSPYMDGDKVKAEELIVTEFVKKNWQTIAQNAYEAGKREATKGFAGMNPSRTQPPVPPADADAFKENAKSLGIKTEIKVRDI